MPLVSFQFIWIKESYANIKICANYLSLSSFLVAKEHMCHLSHAWSSDYISLVPLCLNQNMEPNDELAPNYQSTLRSADKLRNSHLWLVYLTLILDSMAKYLMICWQAKEFTSLICILDIDFGFIWQHNFSIYHVLNDWLMLQRMDFNVTVFTWKFPVALWVLLKKPPTLKNHLFNTVVEKKLVLAI